MAYDNKPNLNCLQFEQCNTDYLYLKGTNCYYSGGTVSSDTGYKVSGVTIFTTGNASSAIQIGCNALANANASTVIGTSACATGITSISIGCNAKACGTGSISIGTLAQSNCNYGIAIGCSNANANCAVAIGEALATGDNSLAIGVSVGATASCSAAIGSYITNNSGCTFGLGWYDGAIGQSAPEILFSNDKSYFYGANGATAKVGFGMKNPVARVDIKTPTPYYGFRLDDGNQDTGRVLTSNADGYATWATLGSISGTESTIPMFDTGGNGFTDSILRHVSPNIIETNYVGTSIIRPKTGSTSYYCLEIQGGQSTVYNSYSPLILKTGMLCLNQPNTGTTYFTIQSNTGYGVNLVACETKISSSITKINILEGGFNSDITYSKEGLCDITTSIGVSSAYNLCGYNAVGGDGNGGDINIYAGSGNSCYNGCGGNITLQAGLHSGTGIDGSIYILNQSLGGIYFCSIPDKSTETCALYIDSDGKISKGIVSEGTMSGTTNVLAKFDVGGENIINSSIKESTDVVCVCATQTVFGNENCNSSVVLKPRDESGDSVNMVIRTGVDTSVTNNDGYLYLDPGRGSTPHQIYVGSDVYNQTSVGFIPEGLNGNIAMVICGKNSGTVQMISCGGVQMGIPNCLFQVNCDCITKSTLSDTCVVGYSTNSVGVSACSVHIRGGIACGASSRGGDLYLCAGYGQGTGCSFSGRMYIKNLLPQSSESNVLFIDDNGAISSGATITEITTCNAITESSGNISLGGELICNTNITANTPYSLNIVSGATINTDNGYYISGTSMLRTGSASVSTIFIGSNSGNITTGENNIGIGSAALGSVSTGIDNIALGANALCASNGNGNIGIGCGALSINTIGDNNIVIGNYAGECLTYSNRLYIGNGTENVLISGDMNTNVLTISGVLCSSSDICAPSGIVYAQDFTPVSDERCKTNIYPIEISPVNIEYKQFNLKSKPDIQRYGVIAQELMINNPELVRVDSDGYMSVSYIDLLVKEVAYLKERVRQLEEMIIN
jgi:hypothetical protein